jgi:hypothetical protein
MSQLSTFVFSRNPAAARAARRKVRSFDLPAVTRDQVELVISELVTTALLREGTERDVIEMSLQHDGEHVVVQINDLNLVGGLLPDGLGAQLLDSLCGSWRARAGTVTASIALGRAEFGAPRRRADRGRRAPGGSLLLEARGDRGRSMIGRPAFSRG